MPDRLKAILAELRAGYEAIYGERLVSLVLFGSQARGDAEPDSDIDVMVVLRGPVSASAELDRTDKFIDKLCLEHDVLLAPIYVSEERYESERSPLLINTRREGVLI